MNNMLTKETLEKSFKTTGRDMLVLALQKVSNEIQHLNRGVTDLRQQMNNMVTKETLEKSFKTTGKDMIVLALQKVSNNIQILHRGVSDLRQQYRRKSLTRTRFSI